MLLVVGLRFKGYTAAPCVLQLAALRVVGLLPLANNAVHSPTSNTQKIAPGNTVHYWLVIIVRPTLRIYTVF